MSNEESVAKRTFQPAKIVDEAVGTLGNLNSTDALGALTLLVNATTEILQIHETESTKREKLRTYRETEVARIKASERVLQDYFDRVFVERRETHKALFDSLDLARVSGDVSAMQTIVGGIVEVARTSPLAGIGNLGELKRAMDDPSTIFEF